jgi:enoyl-CoA hydratase/carnithine racemase
MPTEQLLTERTDGIVTLTLNRPEALNAISSDMAEALVAALEAAHHDRSVRVVIITGAGRAFCSGGDVKAMGARAEELAASVPAQLDRLDTHTRRIPVLLRRIDVPVIAMVNGVAAGWGCDLALACDLRIASDRARFTEAFIKRGLLPDGGATYTLPRLIGPDRALELMWTGDMLDAAEALRLGMVTRVVPHDELEQRTRELAARIAQMAPLAVRTIKRAVYRQMDLDFAQAMEHTALYLGILRQSEDHAEGVRAFVEKREPRFQGR